MVTMQHGAAHGQPPWVYQSSVEAPATMRYGRHIPK